MTKAEVKYTIETIYGENVKIITPLLSIESIIISKFEYKLPNINRNRFKFDTDNEILECYTVKPYNGIIPSSWVLNKDYDEYNGKYYRYLTDDKSGEPLVDYYSFDGIVSISGRGV